MWDLEAKIFQIFYLNNYCNEIIMVLSIILSTHYL